MDENRQRFVVNITYPKDYPWDYKLQEAHVQEEIEHLLIITYPARMDFSPDDFGFEPSVDVESDEPV